jgi:hypothetical protein
MLGAVDSWLGPVHTLGVLEMRPKCERCERNLAPWAEDVFICSFECTWCAECVSRFPGMRCPNCDGVLAKRPARAPEKAVDASPPTPLVFKPDDTSSSRQPGEE